MAELRRTLRTTRRTQHPDRRRLPSSRPGTVSPPPAAAMAAESYYRVTNRLVLLNVTTGPGGINALNGVYGAYTDSLGMLIVSGQVKRETYSFGN